MTLLNIKSLKYNNRDSVASGKGRNIDQWDRRERPEIDPKIWPLDFKQRCKTQINEERVVFPANSAETIG